jgi:hypothetical protein
VRNAPLGFTAVRPREVAKPMKAPEGAGIEHVRGNGLEEVILPLTRRAIILRRLRARADDDNRDPSIPTAVEG